MRLPKSKAVEIKAPGGASPMEELVRTNDAVFLSWLTAHLGGEGIEAVVLDTHTSVMEGSISAIPRRVMVNTEDLWRAKQILAEGERIQAGDGSAGEGFG